MTTSLVTGGTGAVGFSVIEALLARGAEVRALVRDEERARKVLPAGCELVRGDVTDRASLDRAVAGCDVVYHAAGLPEQWLRDPSTFDRVNVGGTQNMIDAAQRAGVKRFAYTSTIDVFAAEPGERFDESVLDPRPKPTHYERSKQEADREVARAVEKGLPAVFLHPAAVYGPVPAGSPGVNDFVYRLAKREFPMLLPGGFPVVYAPDLGIGHVLAAEKAAVGARYILSDCYVHLTELAEMVASKMNLRTIPPRAPLGIARVVAAVGGVISRATGRAPLIPEGQLKFLQWRAHPSSRRAREELGWRPTPLAEGLAETMRWQNLIA